MQLTHNFTVPAEIDQAWEVLLDIERIAPCMPGAAIDTVDGDDFTGTVKVRLGPIGLTYKGKASFVEKDAVGHRAVIDAQGKDARGNGTAKAIITATLTQQGSGTAVNVVTDLNITGKPAQFGRGVMVDVGNKLIGQFADCLAGKLSGPDASSQPDVELAPADVDTETQLDAVKQLDTETQLDAVKQLDIDERLGTVGVRTADLDAAELGVAAADPVRPAGGGESGAGAPPALADTAADAAAVVAMTGAVADEQSVEPAAAAEAAPPAQRLDEVGAPSADRPAQPGAGSRPGVARPPAHRPAAADVEPIDLLGSAGPAIAKRLAPVGAGAVLLALLLLLRRHRRSASRSAERQAAADYWAAVQRWAAAERQLAVQRRDSVKQRQLDRRVLRLAGVLGQFAEPAASRPAVLGRRPGRSRRPAGGRGRTPQ
jgi:carbon monoxide dehydrogenase subunit G